MVIGIDKGSEDGLVGCFFVFDFSLFVLGVKEVEIRLSVVCFVMWFGK